MFQNIVVALLPFVCGLIAGIVIAYPRGFRTGYGRAKQLLPKMVDQAVRDTFKVGGDGWRR